MSFRNLSVFHGSLLVFCLLIAGCSGDGSQSPRTGKLKVTATSGMVADLVRQVAGEHAEVVSLMGEGVDPHIYKPTRNDVKQLMEADVVFYTGLKLEGRMEDTFQQVSRRGKPIFAVADAIPKSELRVPEGMAGHFDPHIWMDVSLWSQCVERVATCLAEADPEHAADYQRNAGIYRAELDELNSWAEQTVQSIPEPQRALVTAHDAFGYFGRRYGLEIRSVQGITTESEAGIRDINDLVDFLVERRIAAIFVESSVSEENILAVIEGAAEKGSQVQIGGELFSDAMGAPGTYEGTYIGMIDHNVTTIARALGGTVSQGGMQGKLSEHP